MRASEKIAIDLLWLRPGKVGGTESYIRNLLWGMQKLKDEFHFVLLTSKDNESSFRDYLSDSRFEMLVADVESKNISKRILWQWFHQNRLLRKNNLRYCFTPVYCRPLFNGGIQYINTIHDIQAYHYPQYHPFHEVAFSKLNWIVDKYFSKHIIVISQFVKDDLMEVYKYPNEKVSVIYNPILINPNEITSFDEIENKYGVKKYQYFYTVSQIIPHKNLNVLLEVMKKIKEENIGLPSKLLISGINGNASDILQKKLKEYSLEENVILTGYVQNDLRNALYQNCYAYLFPSVFEGFGMPAVEAMYWGRPVVTTNCASIPEVTQRKANYVEDPYDVNGWIHSLLNMENQSKELDIDCYKESYIADLYLKTLKKHFGSL